MSDKLEIVKTIAPFAAPVTAAIIETWVKPKLAALHKYIKTDKALFENSVAGKFEEYLLRAYERNSFINVLVFQNQQKMLDGIYIPLTVNQKRSAISFLIQDYIDEFIPTYKKVLIIDAAGMGKSTLMKYLFISCVRRNACIPIFIELRKLKGNESLLSYIVNELNPIDNEFDTDFILKLISQGGFTFFLDGYDEISFSERDTVTNNLQNFMSKAGNNHFILTSRPDASLASFTDFQEFNINPLEAGEAFELLKKYDSGGELSTEIIAKLKSGSFANIEEFLENPLLVSLLYKSYEFKRTIPFKKHVFYRQVYDALYESHDLTKGGAYVREKYSGLDVEDFHRVLRSLGFITVKLGQVEFDKDKWLTFIREAKGRCTGLDFKESQFLKDLLTTVPLFTRDGEYYRWTHKSIQEYFAAQFICSDAKDKQEAILRKMTEGKNTSRFYNVLDICYDVDYRTFRWTVIYDLLNKFERFHESTYTDIDRGIISEQQIQLRKAVTFLSLSGYFPLGWRDKALAAISPGSVEIQEVNDFINRCGISTEGFELRLWGGSAPVFLYKSNEAVLRLLFQKGEDIFLRTSAL